MHSFRLVLADPNRILDDPTDEGFAGMCEAVFAAGGDDATPGASCGVVFIDFDREAASLRDAIESAIVDVNRAGYRVERAEPDDKDVFDQINSELAARVVQSS